VILQADNQLSTLLDLSYPKKFHANKGTHGKGKDQTGRKGADLFIRVPVGTLVRDEDTGELLQDLLFNAEVHGGRRGSGRRKYPFATSTNRAPGVLKGEKGGATSEARTQASCRCQDDCPQRWEVNSPLRSPLPGQRLQTIPLRPYPQLWGVVERMMPLICGC
jgi:hypothetical protein